MKYRPIFLALLTAIVLVSCQGASDYLTNGSDNNDNIEGNVVINSYPTTILPYDSVEVLCLQEEVKSLNKKYNSKYKYLPPRLTKYGFPVREYLPVANMNHPNISFEGKGEMLNITKSTLETFSKFTGVTDISLLRLQCSLSHGPGLTWVVKAENQIYEGLEVIDTRIYVWLDFNGIFRLDCNWYSYIFIPECTISENQAKESIIGLKLYESGWGGISTLIVKQEMLKKPARKVVLPIINDSSIVLPVAWEITVGVNDFSRFYVYVDVVTNAVLKTKQIWIAD